MPEAKCWVCGMWFEYDANDLSPFLWHKHADGAMWANENPNLIRPPRRWYPSNPMKPKKTFWQDWQHFEAKKIGDD